MNNQRGPEKHTGLPRVLFKVTHVPQLSVNTLRYPATMKIHRPKVVIQSHPHRTCLKSTSAALGWPGDGDYCKKGSLAAAWPHPLVTYLNGNTLSCNSKLVAMSDCKHHMLSIVICV